MIRPTLRLAAAASALTTAATLLGCGSDNPPPPRVYMSSYLQVGNNPAATCNLKEGTWIDIGTEANSINDGDTQSGAGVSVQCSVTASGSGFNVFATASLESVVGGTYTVGSPDAQVLFTPGGTVSNVKVVTHGNTDVATFNESDCTFDYTDTDANSGPGIAAGRVWGTVTCPSAVDTAESPSQICEIVSTFRFENCQQ
jgi:hypothetical protein